ncbi:hypothetical protein C0Q70_09639 [Pomacea canaliculata]|uniref:Vacuolar protein sorting-associated protein 51 homolog n=1 Tax=Pomacea canaliculata TaxID=400727 RepID=A0A2T7PAC6_POMCA|nr:hypothetical protein C0Q70_09639 [Pomacea canaliculata]
MLRKSVETRDWLNTIEPRNVRAVMKRVVEDMTAIDSQVGQLYEEGVRRERSSDSSRRTHPHSVSKQTNDYSGVTLPGRKVNRDRKQLREKNVTLELISQVICMCFDSVDNSLMSNIQKLFSEKIEIFSAVEFSKVSVLTGIVKISLKKMLITLIGDIDFEDDSLKRLTQINHSLPKRVLLDEIVCSVVNRCVDPIMMEPSVIDLICERG